LGQPTTYISRIPSLWRGEHKAIFYPAPPRRCSNTYFCESPKSSHQKPAQTELLMSVCPDLRNRHHQLVGSRRGARVAVTKTTIYIFCCPYSRLTEKKTVLCAVNRLLLTPWEVVTGRWPLRQTSDMYFWICGPV
jgi:hypothetical protein